jgi:hypothetical protein
VSVTAATHPSGKPRPVIAVIGAGAYAGNMLVSAFRAAGARLGATVAASEPQQVLDDREVDAVVIATRHDRHAWLAVAALDAGKHVFVETPALRYAELNGVAAAHALASDWCWRALGLAHSESTAADAPPCNSLAVSPHINFFGSGTIRESLRGSGLDVLRPRSFLCGFGFDQIVELLGPVEWNARVADLLPPMLVSDWMFLAEPEHGGGFHSYRRGPYAKFRCWLNFRRWGVR